MHKKITTKKMLRIINVGFDYHPHKMLLELLRSLKKLLLNQIKCIYSKYSRFLISVQNSYIKVLITAWRITINILQAKIKVTLWIFFIILKRNILAKDNKNKAAHSENSLHCCIIQFYNTCVLKITTTAFCILIFPLRLYRT